MTKPILKYQATPSYVERSPFYAITMFNKTIALCGKLLWEGRSATITQHRVDEYLQEFVDIHLGESHTSVYATGLHNIPTGKPLIYMSNHSSWMDIPAMYAAVPGSLRMIAKAGIMQIPIMGKAMKMAGFIGIDRQNRVRAINQLNEAKERLEEGISIWLAPEGTRSRDGAIAPFKKGGFYLALDLNSVIVPTYIEGASKVIPPDSLFVYPNNTITIHFLEPIDASLYSRETINELIEAVRSQILKKQAEVQNNEV